MKKLLFQMLLACSFLQGSAQISKEVTFRFDYDSTEGITFVSVPELVPCTGNGEFVNITNHSFAVNDIEMSFQRTEGNVEGGARFFTKIENGVTIHYLTFTDRMHWIIKGKNGAMLTSLSYPETDSPGGLYLEDGESGTYSYSENKWTCPEGVSQVIFGNSTDGVNAPFFRNVTVTYTMPSDVLKPTSSISDGATISEFKVLELDFGKKMSIQSTDGIAMSDGVALTATVSGSVVRLSAADAVKTDGTYTITIPAGCFRSADGYENAKLTYTFTVSTPKNTFCHTSAAPAEGEVETLSLPIQLTFDGYLGTIDTETTGTIYKDGASLFPVKIRKADGSDKTVEIYSDNVSQSITETGTYTVKIPAGVVYDAFDQTYNPATTLTYIVTGKIVKPTETMKAARALLENSVGVGFPSTESDSYKTLKDLTTYSDSIPSDDALAEAMGEFYKETVVNLPQEGRYYKIYGENAVGNRAYLKYEDGAVTLVGDSSEAATFQAEKHEASVSLKTTDGKYLHVLVGTNDYDATSTKNVTSTYDATVNDIAVNKLLVAGVDSVSQLGLVSLYGCLGKDLASAAEATVSASALVRYDESPSIMTRANGQLQFSELLSSGFRFVETSKPAIDTLTVETLFSLTSEIEVDGTLVLTLPNVQGTVMRNTNQKASITLADGSLVSSDVELTTNTGGGFVVAHDQCADGNGYCLVLPEGFFIYELDGKTVKTQAVSLSFSIKAETFAYLEEAFGDMPAANLSYNLFNSIADSDLNNFMVMYRKSSGIGGLVADPNKTVSIYRYLSRTPTATGHFETLDYEINGREYYAAKLVLDTPIQEGSLSKDIYLVVCEEASLGDLNFGKWLEDPTSVKKGQCRVNKKVSMSFEVNYNTTGIDNINGNEKEDEIFDMQGRRLVKITRPGIYIVNGRKMVKR